MIKDNSIFKKFYELSPAFVKNIEASIYSLYIAKKKYGKQFNFWSDLLEKSQYWDNQTLRSFQKLTFFGFLEYVQKYSSFYAASINKALNNYTDKPLKEIIHEFPVISKQDVRNNYADILSKNGSQKLYKFSSSGTTGTSLHVYLDNESYEREYAFRWHFLSVAGASRKDKFAYFVGNKLFPVGRNRPPYHILDFYENGIFFSIFHMSDETLGYYVDAFNEFKPKFIKGYPSGIYAFANYIKKSGKRINKPKAVFSASEVLRDYQKELMEEVFQAPVYQWYGQVETTVNIHECEKRRFHVKEEYGLLELLNESGEIAKPGEIASAIGTGWGNKVFPLIRYDTCDNMILSEETSCPCGRNGRLIKEIIGRDEDVIYTPEGRMVGRLDFIFKPINSVKESQIIQEDINKLTIRIIPLESFKENDKQLIRYKIKEYLGNSFNINIVEVEELDRTKAGKIKYVINKMKDFS